MLLKFGSPQEIQNHLRRLIATCGGTEKPHRQRLAADMRLLASRLEGGIAKSASLTEYDTLSQILDMEVENVTGGEPVDAEVPAAAWRAVEQAADRYENDVEKTLLEWVKNNMEKLRIGEKALRTVRRPSDVVDVMMELRGGASYLYFMEAEGHGVGTWDGDWDILFKDHHETLKDLSKHVERKTSGSYTKLKSALENAAYEMVPEGEDDEDY